MKAFTDDEIKVLKMMILIRLKTLCPKVFSKGFKPRVV